MTPAEEAAREFAALDAIIREDHPRVGDTRMCDCGRPQHYSGVEVEWAHDALVDTWHCADPRKAYSGPTCSHPHNLPYNDECAVWWLRGTADWQAAHTDLAADPHKAGA